MQCELGFSHEACGLFEISEGNKVAVVWRLRTAIIGHGKQGRFVAPRPHHFHGFKQVCFGPAEPEVVFVAVQDSHENFLGLVRYFQDDGGNRQPRCPDCVDD